MQENYFALQLSAKLNNKCNSDVFSPFFAGGAVATGLLEHAARTAYFMPNPEEATAFYEHAVAKVMKDFSLPGDRLNHSQMQEKRPTGAHFSLIRQHYEHQMKLDDCGVGKIGDYYLVKKGAYDVIEIIATDKAGVSFSSINLQTGRIIYEQPLESGFSFGFTSFLTLQDADAWLCLIEYLENTLA